MAETVIKAVHDKIIRSGTDAEVELFYRDCEASSVSHKLLSIVVKVLPDGSFMGTAYFTDTVKNGLMLWKRK